ncbi:MAG: HPr family phosphocarrier protein [Candidatus Zixiibacteriota bacterium]
MTQHKAKIINRLGMHARPSAMFVTHASKFKSEIFVEKIGYNIKVNGKSIMGVMMLAAAKGEELLIYAEGEDEKDAAKALAKLVSSGFGELKDL